MCSCFYFFSPFLFFALLIHTPKLIIILYIALKLIVMAVKYTIEDSPEDAGGKALFLNGRSVKCWQHFTFMPITPKLENILGNAAQPTGFTALQVCCGNWCAAFRYTESTAKMKEAAVQLCCMDGGYIRLDKSKGSDQEQTENTAE